MDSNFFILISFLFFSYIFYKKLWPSLASMLDEHIATIKKQIAKQQTTITENEKLEIINQQRLQHLQKETNDIKKQSLEKLEILKKKINEDMEYQYVHRQKSFHLAIKRIKAQQLKSLQSRCVNEIFKIIVTKIEKNSSVEDKYMLCVAQLIKDGSAPIP